jgi:histidyl-tRNA synthetase
VRVAVGKKSLADGKVEVKHRREKEARLVPVAEAAAHVAALVREELEKLAP